MKTVLLLTLTAWSTALHLESNHDSDLLQWDMFKIEYGKQYERAEEPVRRAAFMENLKFISEHNAKYESGQETVKVALNEYSDLTREEFSRLHGCLHRSSQDKEEGEQPQQFPQDVDLSDVPASLDWRTEGAVTPVKNQGSKCGSCWAFATTGSLEGANFLKSKKLVSLSEQNLVDCDNEDHGCEGGLPSRAIDYIKKNKGIDTEASYPYVGKKGECRFINKTVGAEVTGYVSVPKGDEEKLKWAVAKAGPIAVGIDANHLQFSGYSQGVFSLPDCSTEELDHGVLVVGYGTTSSGEDYWIIKNSWGQSWGMKGYFLLARNKNNMCGVATLAVYPTD